MARPFVVDGHGLGLRRPLLRQLDGTRPVDIAFWEIAPENWIDIGGALGRRLRAFTERQRMVCHGLALNLGGTAVIDQAHVRRVGQFLEQHGVLCYSEHLSYCADDGQLYDLLPIPFTGEAVVHVGARIAQVQDMLGRRIAIENVSYYCAPGAELSEREFLCAVLDAADCDLLLDVNNVYVNSINHGYDAEAFIAALPGARIAYGHIAGHHRESADLLVDTHGADVIDPVWSLLGFAYRCHGVFPTLLERDFDLPPLPQLLAEAAHIARVQAAYPQTTASAGRARVLVR